MTILGNSLMSHSLELGEVSLIILAWLYDSLGMLRGMTLMTRLSKELYLTMRTMSKVIVKDLYEIRAW